MNMWHGMWLLSALGTILLLFKWYGRRPDRRLTAAAFLFVFVSGYSLHDAHANSVVTRLLVGLTWWIVIAFLIGSATHHRMSRHGQLRKSRTNAQSAGTLTDETFVASIGTSKGAACQRGTTSAH